MLTAEEYAELKPDLLWIHGIEALGHCLKKDHTLSAYKDNSPITRTWEDLVHKLSKHMTPDGFADAVDEGFRKEYKVLHHDSRCGELDIDRYLDREDRCFTEYYKENLDKPAITIVLDGSVAAYERSSDYMVSRHQRVYEIALEAEAQNKPCRVIAAMCNIIPEIESGIKILMVIKDYKDPIFPAIWGAFKDNETTNDWANVYMDYIVGTRTSGNGMPMSINIDEYIFGDDIIVIEPSRVHTNIGKIIGKTPYGDDEEEGDDWDDDDDPPY